MPSRRANAHRVNALSRNAASNCSLCSRLTCCRPARSLRYLRRTNSVVTVFAIAPIHQSENPVTTRHRKRRLLRNHGATSCWDVAVSLAPRGRDRGAACAIDVGGIGDAGHDRANKSVCGCPEGVATGPHEQNAPSPSAFTLRNGKLLCPCWAGAGNTGPTSPSPGSRECSSRFAASLSRMSVRITSGVFTQSAPARGNWSRLMV